MTNYLKAIGAWLAALFLGTTNQSEYVASTTPVPELYYSTADLIVADGLMFEIKASDFFDNSGADEIQEGHQLYGVCISVTNIGVSDSYFDPDDVQIYANGVLCESYLYGNNLIELCCLERDNCLQGWVYYLVPNDTTNIALKYTFSFAPEAYILFKLQ